VPLQSTEPCLRQRIRGVTPGLCFLDNPPVSSACGVAAYSVARPPPRVEERLSRSDDACSAAVGPHYPPGRLWVNGLWLFETAARLRVHFGPGPSTHLGRLSLTTVQSCVRLLTIAALLESVCGGGFAAVRRSPPLLGLMASRYPGRRAVPPFTMRGGYCTHRRVISCRHRWRGRHLIYDEFCDQRVAPKNITNWSLKKTMGSIDGRPLAA
jgi:hypothetical protein